MSGRPTNVVSTLMKGKYYPGKIQEVQAGQCREGYGANLPGSHCQAHKEQDSDWEEPVWLCQRQMTSGQPYCLL